MFEKREEDADYITTELAKAVCTNEINNSIAVKSYGEVGGNDNPNAVIDECTFDVKVYISVLTESIILTYPCIFT